MARIIITRNKTISCAAHNFDVYLMNTYIGELKIGGKLEIDVDVGSHMLFFKSKLKFNLGNSPDTSFKVVVNSSDEIIKIKSKFDISGNFIVEYADTAPHIPLYETTVVNESKTELTNKHSTRKNSSSSGAFLLGLIILIFAIIISTSNKDNDTKEISDNINVIKSDNITSSTNVTSRDKSTSNNEEITLSEGEYKAKCQVFAYSDIERTPNNYTGQKAYFKGKVVQVQEIGKSVTLRISTTQGEYGLWDDTIYVNYRRKTDDEVRILEDDIVTVYGEIKGIKEYRAVLGNQISIPHIKAEYIDIN